jgi:hypothetical protein
MLGRQARMTCLSRFSSHSSLLTSTYFFAKTTIQYVSLTSCLPGRKGHRPPRQC